jgi:hypothetical protein
MTLLFIAAVLIAALLPKNRKHLALLVAVEFICSRFVGDIAHYLSQFEWSVSAFYGYYIIYIVWQAAVITGIYRLSNASLMSMFSIPVTLLYALHVVLCAIILIEWNPWRDYYAPHWFYDHYSTIIMYINAGIIGFTLLDVLHKGGDNGRLSLLFSRFSYNRDNTFITARDLGRND